jgi:glycosyltransferase involved in cell wall biosynthesis
MKIDRITHEISHALLRLNVILRDLDLRSLRLLVYGLRHGAWTSIHGELFPNDVVLHREHGSNFLTTEPRPERRNVLVIDRSLPRFDRDAGSRATWQYIQLLVEMGYSVTVWGHDYLRREPYASLLESMGVKVLSGWTVAIGRWRTWVRRHVHELDFVVLHRPNVAQTYIDFFRKVTNARILYFGVDLRWLRNQRRFEVERQALFHSEAQYWRTIETRLIDMADCSYFYSEVEVTMALQQVPHAKVRALPLFLYKKLEQDVQGLGARRGLLFVGGFAHQPNVDGILWFVETILPLIQARLGKVMLKIVGAGPPAELCDKPGVELLGAVSDTELDSLYGEARIVVAPLRYGAGIKGKVVEALFQQVPLVTTTIGAEGLPESDSVLNVCNLPKEFAESVIELYLNDELWLARSSGINAYLAVHFSQDRARRILEEEMS